MSQPLTDGVLRSSRPPVSEDEVAKGTYSEDIWAVFIRWDDRSGNAWGVIQADPWPHRKKKKTTHQSCALVARRERLWLAEHQLTVLSSTQKHLNLSDGREIRVCRQTSEDWLTVENGRKSTHALTRNYYTALSASCHFVTFDDIHQHNMDGMR